EKGHSQKERNFEKDSQNDNSGHEEGTSLTAEEIFQQMRRKEMDVLLRAGFPDSRQQYKSKSVREPGKQSQTVEKYTNDQSQGKPAENVEEVFQQLRKREMEILLRAGFPYTKQQVRCKSDEDVTKHAKTAESNTPQHPQNVEEVFQQMRKKEMETLLSAGFPDTKQTPRCKSEEQVARHLKTIEKDPHQQKITTGNNAKQNCRSDSPTDVEELFQQMRKKEIDVLRKAGFSDTKQLACSESDTEDVKQLPRSNPVGEDEIEKPQKEGTGEASIQTSESKGVEKEVEELFQQMRKKEIEILQRVGFPDSKDRIKHADDDIKPQSKSETAEKDTMQHLRNRTSDDESKGDFQGDSPGDVEELFQQMRQKEIDILRKAGFPETKEQPCNKSIEEDIQQLSQSKPVEKKDKEKSQSKETVDATRQESQNKNTATNVEELFQKMRKREMEILLRAGFPDTKVNADDNTKLQNKTKTTEKESKQQPQGKGEATTLKDESKNAEKDESGDNLDVNQGDSIESFTGPMYWCCICIYRRRAHNKKQKDVKQEKRPGLLKRFRRFLSRTFRRERQE
ncbi:nexilin-like, partial [Saccostrea cucullata]|uniref:nexilin-like n=1 Tax=Saccostrea cuccullata TaxID=36930 RepID=UPI002ED13A9A